MEQEKWINDILDSTKGITSVTPDATLFLKIQNQIKQKSKVAPKWVWMAAATIAVLIGLNIKVVFFKSKSEKPSVERMASYISKSNQLY